VSSQYLISTRSLGRCCLGLMALLVAAGGAAGGAAGPRGCSQSPSIAPCHSEGHTPLHYFQSCCFFVFAAMGVTSTKPGRLEVNLSLSGKRGGKNHLGTNLLSAVSGTWRFCMVIRSLLPISLETIMHDPKEPVLLIALKIMRHAMLCLSVIMFLICVCWHPERMCRALSTCGQGASLTC